MGFENPLGQEIEIFEKKGTVIGVVKDYHFESLHTAIRPLVLRFSQGDQNYLYAKIRSGKFLALVIALSTVMIHTAKAALVNPTISLKYE